MNLEKLLSVLMFSAMVAMPVTATAETATAAPAATATARNPCLVITRPWAS